MVTWLNEKSDLADADFIHCDTFDDQYIIKSLLLMA